MARSMVVGALFGAIGSAGGPVLAALIGAAAAGLVKAAGSPARARN